VCKTIQTRSGVLVLIFIKHVTDCVKKVYLVPGEDTVSLLTKVPIIPDFFDKFSRFFPDFLYYFSRIYVNLDNLTL